MRLRRLLCNAAAFGALASGAYAQTGSAPMTVIDGNSAKQPLCEYQIDGTNRAGCTIPYGWNGAWTIAPGPCSKSFSQTISASADLVQPSNYMHICSILVASTTQQQVSVVEGAGTICGTGTQALYGDTTAGPGAPATGLQMFAGQALSVATGTPFRKTQVSGDHFCVLIGASTAGGSTGPVTVSVSYSDY